MTGDYLLEQLLESFESSYDVERTCELNGNIYDAYAAFRAENSKYVLVKKAELWKAKCFEHVFFRKKATLTQKDIEEFRKQIENFIDPELVRHGEKWPEKDHMYTYMTAVYICENGISEEIQKMIKKFRYVKNYCFTVRGYSEARILVFDLKNQKILGNPAAKELVKGYRKANIF